MKHKGYVGLAEVDEEAGVIRGRVINTRDVITFQGKTVEEARKAFEDSVDDYLEFCQELGREPEKPFSGQFLVRIDPDVQRDLNIIAETEGISVNKLVTRELGKLTRRAGPMAVGKATKRAAAKKAVPAKGVKKAARGKKAIRRVT